MPLPAREQVRDLLKCAGSRGKLKGRRPKLTARQQAEHIRMHATGEYTTADLMEVFSIGHATVYRLLNRATSVRPSPADAALAAGA